MFAWDIRTPHTSTPGTCVYCVANNPDFGMYRWAICSARPSHTRWEKILLSVLYDTLSHMRVHLPNFCPSRVNRNFPTPLYSRCVLKQVRMYYVLSRSVEALKSHCATAALSLGGMMHQRWLFVEGTAETCACPFKWSSRKMVVMTAVTQAVMMPAIFVFSVIFRALRAIYVRTCRSPFLHRSHFNLPSAFGLL